MYKRQGGFVMKQGVLVVAVLSFFLLFAPGCGEEEAEDSGGEVKVGSLVFTVNAEDFVRDGFDTEDNWHIDFDHVYINIQGPTAYQVPVDNPASKMNIQPPFKHAGHPHTEIPEGAAHKSLTGEFFVDGHQGPDPIEIGRVDNAPIGNYNYMNFNIQKATAASDGLVAGYGGYSVVLIGTATDNDGGDTVSFNIKLTEEMNYSSCGPHPENIGVVAEGGTGEAQATFHFDHIFGDLEEGPVDPSDPDTINYIAIGFGPFAALATGAALDVTQADLQSMPEYDQFLEALLTIGHSGEAHCHIEEE